MFSSTVVIISFGRVVQIVASLLAVRLFTSLLTTAEVGNLYLVNSLVAFFGFALLNPVGMYIHRKLNRWVSDGTLLDRFFLYNGFVVAVAFVSIPALFSLNRFFSVGGGLDLRQLLLYVPLYIFANTWNQIIVATFNLLEHRVSFVGYTILTTLTGLALSVLLVMQSRTAIWWLAGQVAAQIVVTLVAFVHLRRLLPQRVGLRRTREEMTTGNLRQVLAFVAPLSATTMLVWVQSQSYRVIIETRVGLEFLGQIGLGLSLAANIAAAVESVAQQVYLPAFYREVTAGDGAARRDACNRMFQRTLPSFLALALAVTCLAPFLVRLLAHARFEGAFLFVMYGAWIELLRMTTGLLTIAAHAEMQTRYLVKAYVVGSVLAVAGVFGGTCIGRYEQTIPAGLVVAGLVTMAIMFVEMRKIVQLKVGIRQIITSGLLSLPCAGALFFFPLRESIVVSLLVTGVAGSYLLLVQYLIYRRTAAEG